MSLPSHSVVPDQKYRTVQSTINRFCLEYSSGTSDQLTLKNRNLKMSFRCRKEGLHTIPIKEKSIYKSAILISFNVCQRQFSRRRKVKFVTFRHFSLLGLHANPLRT